MPIRPQLVYAILALVCLTLPSFAEVLLEDTSAYRNLKGSYEQTGELAHVYRLARLSYQGGRYQLALQWLTILESRQWQMGIDRRAFDNVAPDRDINTLINLLQERVPNPDEKSTPVLTLQDPEVIPESIAYSSNNQTLYVGSLYKRKLVARTLGKTPGPDRDLPPLPHDAYGAIYGIKYDHENNRLWVLHNELNDGQLEGRLTVVDPQGKLIKHFETATETPAELNDLCLTESLVFVTDSQNHRVFKGSKSGSTLRVHVDDGLLRYPNGIACHRGSDEILVADYSGIVQIDAGPLAKANRLTLPSAYSLAGVDGLYLWQDRLVGIQNALGTPKIVIASLPDRVRITDVEFRDAFLPAFRIPTTGFILNDCLYYIANTSLDALRPDGSLDADAAQPEQATVRGLDLTESGRTCSLK